MEDRSAACSPFVPKAEPGSIAQLSTLLVNCRQAAEKPESALMEDASNALRDRPIEKMRTKLIFCLCGGPSAMAS
jgi:hypothetical protein